MTIPNPERRDIGPYHDAVQVARQFRNWAKGIPMTDSEAAGMLLVEAAMMASVLPSPYELNYISDLAGSGKLDPVLATILHAWVIRAAVSVDNEVKAWFLAQLESDE